jgi:hypothetical protein
MRIRDLFQSLLVGHEIVLKDEFGNEICRGDQLTGQLMGSVLSFPVLCVANASLCRLAMEIGFKLKNCQLRDLPLIVNGDDCVFHCNPTVDRLWVELAKGFGMEPSIGKVYRSYRFININSTFFFYRPENLTSTGYRPFVLNKFVNFGLLLMKKRSGISLDQDIYGQFGSYASNSRDILEKSPEHLLDFLYPYFLKGFRKLAGKMNIQVPWFVPQKFGAIGLRPYGRFQPSPQDRAVCQMLQEKGKINVRTGKESTWHMYNLYNKFVKDSGAELYESPNGIPEGFSLFLVNRLLDISQKIKDTGYLSCNHQLFDLINWKYCSTTQKQKTEFSASQLKYNTRVWARLLPRVSTRHAPCPWGYKDVMYQPLIMLTDLPE